MAEYYKTQAQLQAERRKKRKDDEGGAVTLALFVAAAAIWGICAYRKHKQQQVSGVGRPLADTQLSFDYTFDDELGMWDKKRAASVYDPAKHPDIEEAWAAMENSRRPVWERAGGRDRFDAFDYVVDRETGDEFHRDTVFEVYKQNRYSLTAPIEFLHEITGDDLERLTTVVTGDINKAKKFGFTLYIYQDGQLIETVNE